MNTLSHVTPIRARTLTRARTWTRYALLAALLIYTLLPIIWIISTALKPRALILSSDPVLFTMPDFSAFTRLLSRGPDSILPEIANSLVIAVGTTLFTLVLASLAAYAFSRFRFRGRRALLFSMLATRLLPPITAVIPLFLLFNDWQLIDTKRALILVYTALNIPLATWLMKTFFDGVPVELEEAAQIDGASRLRILWAVTLPLARPGLAATAIFTYVLAWNEFVFGFILTSTDSRTVPVVLSQTIGELEIFWQDMAAITTILMIPTMAVAVFVQRSIVQGLTAGSLK